MRQLVAVGMDYGTTNTTAALMLGVTDEAKVDKYGRTVANVRCAGTDVATAQVRAGLAWVYTPYVTTQSYLEPLQQQARSHSTGLWSQRRPQAPWSYRHRQQRAKER